MQLHGSWNTFFFSWEVWLSKDPPGEMMHFPRFNDWHWLVVFELDPQGKLRHSVKYKCEYHTGSSHWPTVHSCPVDVTRLGWFIKMSLHLDHFCWTVSDHHLSISEVTNRNRRGIFSPQVQATTSFKGKRAGGKKQTSGAIHCSLLWKEANLL